MVERLDLKKKCSSVKRRAILKTPAGRKSFDLKAMEKDGVEPKVVRVQTVAEQLAATSPPVRTLHNESKQQQLKKSLDSLLYCDPGIKPKVVRVRRPSDSKHNFNIPPEFRGIKPIVRQVVRVKKDPLKEDSMKPSQTVPLIDNTKNNLTETVANHDDKAELLLKNDNICETPILVSSIENLMMMEKPIMGSEERSRAIQFDSGNTTVEELAINQQVQNYYSRVEEQMLEEIVSNDNPPQQQQVMIDNVPHVIENGEDGSKIIRIQVEPLRGDDGTFYEEVVIRCDNTEMFDGGVVGLAFGHDDAIEDSAFL